MRIGDNPVTRTGPTRSLHSSHQLERRTVTPDPRIRRDPGFSVLNDFRYLTDSDKGLLREVTGEEIEPSVVDRPGAASAFALQLALDRRTGEIAPHQEVTAVYLKNRAGEIDEANRGRPNARNPYHGEVMDRAVAYLESIGRGRADIRL